MSRSHGCSSAKFLVAILAVFAATFFPSKSASCEEHDSAYQQPVPDTVSLRAQLGIVFAKSGRRADARQEFQKLMEQPVGRATALTNLGNLEFIEDRVKEALKNYEQAAALDEKDAGILLNKGVALYFLGEIEESQEVFNAGVEMLGGVEEAMYLLGYHEFDFSGRGESSRVAAVEIREMLYKAAALLEGNVQSSDAQESRRPPASPGGLRGVAVIAEQNLYWKE